MRSVITFSLHISNSKLKPAVLHNLKKKISLIEPPIRISKHSTLYKIGIYYFGNLITYTILIGFTVVDSIEYVVLILNDDL